ncbi:MAG: putative xylanase/chitin deacetylase [Capsulimonas sp.]|jgi:peptidoglycan/xylan/chitin deacetylase (PgdA/CDA1 family)|nr:putative xylanase/chitin deacetylase [Capsulimonas sp.]
METIREAFIFVLPQRYNNVTLERTSPKVSEMRRSPLPLLMAIIAVSMSSGLAAFGSQPAIGLKRAPPNETGLVPILEYHELVPKLKVTGYQYPSALFRREMEWLYNHNYRPINLLDYVAGKIDCPTGMSPVILTFDDALGGQFRYLADGSIDPNCAVGILEDLHRRHTDWPLRGSFFVLTDGNGHLPAPFYQKKTALKKMRYLVSQGFEVGNHTVSHAMGIKHWTDEHVENEVGGAVVNIQKYLPGYDVREIALPFGIYPKSVSLLKNGVGQGFAYHNDCAMMAGYQPAPSPMDKRFDPYHLERIIPGDKAFQIRYWLDWLEAHPKRQFVSDGDPATYTLPVTEAKKLDRTRLFGLGFRVQFYKASRSVTQKLASHAH